MGKQYMSDDDVVELEELERRMEASDPDDDEGEEDEPEKPTRAKPVTAQDRSVAFPAGRFYGPWEKDEATGATLVVKTVQFPPSMWALCLDLSLLFEMKGAASYIRRAVSLAIVQDAERDPRVQAVLRAHNAARMVGLEEG